jgi:hypothetical protein
MRIETFEAMVSAIQALPAGPRKTCLALSCNEVAEAFHALRNDVTAATKASAPKVAPPTKRKHNVCAM